MKIKFGFLAILFATSLFVASCSDDPDPVPPVDVPSGDEINLPNGWYVIGAGTGVTGTDVAVLAKGLMVEGKNEEGQVARPESHEIYIAVAAGAEGFQIVNIDAKVPTYYGPDAVTVVDSTLRTNDEPKVDFQRGTVKSDKTAFFTVPADGLYHVVYDEELETVAIVPVTMGIIGGATPGGWSASTNMTPSAFSKTSITFTLTDAVVFAGEWKYRYSDGWKVEMSADPIVKFNTNFGGSVAELIPGGANIANDVAGKYTFVNTWTLGTGWVATATKTGTVEVPTYPEEMFIVGAATAYDWTIGAPNAEMHKTAGGASFEGIFWKICYLEAGKGFKLSAAAWAEPNLDFSKVDEFDAEGVAVADSSNNWAVAESGMYVVVLNLRDEAVKVSIKPADVYLIGGAVAAGDPGYVSANPAAKFTVDNTAKTLVSPAVLATAELRMYANHPWLGDWWHAEFIVNGTALEYRNAGDDQARVAVTAGQVVTLHFDDNTGSIQ